MSGVCAERWKGFMWACRKAGEGTYRGSGVLAAGRTCECCPEVCAISLNVLNTCAKKRISRGQERVKGLLSLSAHRCLAGQHVLPAPFFPLNMSSCPALRPRLAKK